MEGRHGGYAVKPAFRQFIEAFAVQLGKSTVQGLVGIIGVLVLTMLR
jgi:hypothetical protein